MPEPRVERAAPTDVPALARLVWLDTTGEEPADLTAFAAELASWWADGSHTCVVARVDDEVVGMAWVALVPRVPRPGAVRRWSADLQTVYVLPEHRGRGLGGALVAAAVEEAGRLGAARVTVHSGRRAVPLYERLGFVSSPQLRQVTPGSSAP